MTQVRCAVKGVFVAVNDAATVPLVVLSDGSDRVLPIFIGIWEAVSINSAINHELLPRPFTHDLFIDLCEKCTITLRFLQIDSIEDGVYYAQLVFMTGGPSTSTVARVMESPLPSGGMSRSLLKKPFSHRLDRRTRTSLRLLTLLRSCKNKGVIFCGC